MTEKVERKRSKTVILIIILLLIIAFLVWLLLRPATGAKRTGNVDIYNINVNCVCGPTKDPDEDCDKDGDGEPDDAAVSYSGNIREHGTVYVDDINGWYTYQNSLKIFENTAFEYTNKIAPGVSNSYDFRVHNVTLRAINYRIKFEEESEYAVNLRYRLLRNDSYIIGDEDTWVSASELESALIYLPGDTTDEYTLDWEWPYEGGTDEADTEAGEKMASEYRLSIKIVFEEA